MMRSHYVDTPWATGTALPRPSAGMFDAQGKLKSKLNFHNFDQWIALWPGARRYFVFAAVGDSFAGAPINTAEFNARVGSWAKVLSAHMKDIKLKPSQLGILLVDEPHNDQQAATIAAWAKAINASAPQLTLFEDPTWLRPDQLVNQDAITQIDVLCPQLPIYKKGGKPVQKYFEHLRASGKELWFYQCTGPVRLYDPQAYYRYQPWQAFAIGATGQGYWAFGATNGAPTSWNEYTMSNTSFTPAFIDTNTVYDSIHWDATREGIEDYEELAMLQDAIKKSHNTAWKNQAQQVLDDAVKTVTDIWSDDYDWAKERNPELADVQLQKIRDVLTERG